MFKKLLVIKYKNKKFQILITDYGRYTFLEIDEDGRYLYPQYEDYAELNEIYNNYDYTTLYDYNSRLLTYDEKVVLKKEMICAVLSASIAFSRLYNTILTINNSKTELSIAFQKLYKDSFEDKFNINQAYNNEIVTREDVISVINNNDNLNDYYKKMAIEVLDLHLELDPEANLRIYYENMKKLRISIKSEQVITENNTINRAGYFNYRSNVIGLMDYYSYHDITVAHELTHAFHHLIDTTNDKVIVITDTKGFSLNEAMTEQIVSNKYPNASAYSLEQKLLSFFIDNVDKFNYHIYNEIGIMALIDELKEKYPDVDIDFLIDYIDAYTKSSYHMGIELKQPYEDKEFVDELFNITLRNIDKDDMFLSFDTFKILMKDFVEETFFDEYYKKYSNEIIKQGIISEEQFNLINNMNSLCLINGNLYVSDSENSYFDYDGNKVNLTDSSNAIFMHLDNILLRKLINHSNMKPYSKNFIHLLLKNSALFLGYEKINEDLSESDTKLFLDAMFTLFTENINSKDFYINFWKFHEIFALCSKCDYFELERNELYKHYLKTYEEILVSKNLVDANAINQLDNICGFAKIGDNYYPATSQINSSGFIIETSSLYHQYLFALGSPLNIEYINDNNELASFELNKDFVDFCPIKLITKMKIIQYATDKNYNDILNRNFINEILGNNSLLPAPIIPNTFSDGTVAFDEVKDSMYIEFGLDKNNNLQIKLFDEDNLIYGSREEFSSSTNKLPYETFIRLQPYQVSTDSIEQALSIENIYRINENFREYMFPNLGRIDQEIKRTDETGETRTSYTSKFTINGNYPKAIIDGKETDLGKTYLLIKEDGTIYLNFFDGTSTFICDTKEERYHYIEEPDHIIFLKRIINFHELNPDENNTYHFSKEEILNLATDYVNTTFDKDFNDKYGAYR